MTRFSSFRIIVLLAAAIAVSACSPSVNLQPGTQQALTFQTKITTDVKYDYLLYLPDSYSESKKMPLIIFLHGSGERGSDIDLVKVHGPPKLVSAGKKFPFIIASPQCPPGVWWNTDYLNLWLDELLDELNVDEDRIYLTGLSMGGYASWAWAAEAPEQFAAIAPICGGGEPATAQKIKHIPAWVFHGGQDNVVAPAESERMVEALEQAGGDVRLTIYPEAGHDSWTETYNNSELYEWFLQHARQRN